MADPGVDGEIQKAENQLEPDWDDDWQAEWDEEETLTQPSRWWFASTAFPLVAGTFGPMANGFNICALVQPWRERIPPNRLEGFGENVIDPTFIIAVNAVSLVLALAANAALFLNMVGRVSFAIAQPITTIGFMLASVTLLAIVGVAGSGAIDLQDLPPGYSQDLTQAFYYACFAAALYFLVSVLMNVTVWGAIAGKYDRQFHITYSQRTLMVQTITFMAYLLIGAAIFSRIEGWRYNDAVYWSSYTLLTIGVGDRFVPKTHLGRSLMIIYTFGGILAVGLVISSIRSMILEKGAEKLHARTTERKRQRVHTLDDAEWGRGHSFSRFLPKKKAPDTSSMSERERRKAEFHAMRRIQHRVEKTNQYQSLAISCFNAAMLWLLGALVFYEAEKAYQKWTYFDGIYFSYVTLITLGYGDLQPKSNLGKSFFVFWTLLAIPTLTVLISDMSDTVVKGIAEATNWLSQLTISFGDQEFYDEIKRAINLISRGTLFKSVGQAEEEDDRILKQPHDKARYGGLNDFLETRLSDTEKAAIDDFCKNTSETPEMRDTHMYHFLLMKEIRRLLVHTGETPPRQYTFDEWAYYLKILGHDEDDPAYHTVRYNTLEHGKRDDENAPQVTRVLDHDGNPRHWSWLSLRSPLIGLTTEPQWLLNRLLNKLEGELQFSGKPGRGIGDVPPPISLSKFRGFTTCDEIEHYMHGMHGKELKKREATFG